ncbi:MAG: hypothetical protein V3T90_10860, partial [Anaerolineae bacterium]
MCWPVFDFASCEGCQLTVIDALQTHLDLLGAVEVVQFREAMTEKGENYQIAFIEGSCTRASDGFSYPIEDCRKVTNEECVPFSTAKWTHHNRESYMVGALARLNNNFDQLHPR